MNSQEFLLPALCAAGNEVLLLGMALDGERALFPAFLLLPDC